MSEFIDKLRILWMLLRASYDDWRKKILPHELDARYCCDGRECGCGGSTMRDLYLWKDPK